MIYRTLGLRRRQERLFREGSYLPLEAAGDCSAHLVAMARSLDEQSILVAVPRLVFRLMGGQRRLPLGSDVWRDTWLPVPSEVRSRSFRNLYTGELLEAVNRDAGPALLAAEVFRSFPVALLHPE